MTRSRTKRSPTIWFKGHYVDPILNGEKTNSLRANPPHFAVGDTVNFSVGPRPPFARALITAICNIPWTALTPSEQSSMENLYGSLQSVWRFHFEIID